MDTSESSDAPSTSQAQGTSAEAGRTPALSRYGWQCDLYPEKTDDISQRHHCFPRKMLS